MWILLSVLLLLASCTGSSPTGLDPSFGTDGKVTTAFGSGDDEAFAVAVQSDGKIVVAGRTFSSNQHDFALARYNTDGTLDSSFGTQGLVTTDFSGASDSAYALAILSDGSILAAGSARGGAQSLFAFAKYTTDGVLDNGFDTDGKLTIPLGSAQDEIRAMIIQPDGYIVAAGFSQSSTNFDMAVVRISATGILDTSFDTDGKKTIRVGIGDDKVYALALQNDGSLLLAGSALINNTSQFALVRLLSDGTLDSLFGNSGTVTLSSSLSTSSLPHDSASGVSVLIDGSIVMSGKSDSGSTQQIFAARLNSVGALMPQFSGNGRLLTAYRSVGTSLSSFGAAQLLQPDGNILIAGTANDDSGTDFGLLRIDSQGVADAAFGIEGIETLDFGSSEEATAVAVWATEAMFVAGKAFNGNNYDFALAKYFQ